MKHRTPAYYRAPLRSRAAIVAFLKDAANGRPSYGLFTFNVKAYGVDLSFDNLAKRARECGELAKDASPRYLAECRAEYEETGEGQLCEWAIEQARENVKDFDTNRMLWNGDKAIAEWSFAGRSGGWLALESFEGMELGESAVRRHGSDMLWDSIAGSSFPFLRRLYRFVVQCLHDFRREAVESEIEHQAAFALFVNLCTDVETDEQAAEREAAEGAEAVERAHWEARDTVTV